MMAMTTVVAVVTAATTLGTDYAPAILLQTLHASAPSIFAMTL